MPKERTRRRGRLRIYLGCAPGVGKTYAMLGEAHRRVERGTDVVTGIVETHGRAQTDAVLAGLEVVPRRVINYRGTELTELDVPAVLAREPAVVLVDELAHTNAPGSKHEKRWQDIDELLAAGIDVLSTVNVQHLESLNDVVQKITGVRQRETVPDDWVREADQIELVDITPEALRQRMAQGHIYRPEKIDAALSHYFKPVNLVALREMALLWVAGAGDDATRRYRAEAEQPGRDDSGAEEERVVVAVTGGPESETVIRRAARIAQRAGDADLLCVHILRPDGLGVAPHALPKLRRLADDVGASFHTVVGGDEVPAALLDFARGANATQLVLGTSRRSRLARLLRGSIGAIVVRDCGPIDVHLVTHTEGDVRARRRPRRSPLPARRRVLGWLLAFLLPTVATAAGMTFGGVLGLPSDVVLFLAVTVVVALVGGLRPALFAAAAGGLMLNYLLTPPIFAFTLDRGSLIALGAMVAVAIAVDLVVDTAARRAEQANRARTEAALLASFARTSFSPADPLRQLLEKTAEVFALSSVALLERSDEEPDGWIYVACLGSPDCVRPEDAEIDVEVDDDHHLVGTGGPLAAADRRLLETVGGQALLALRGNRMAEEAVEARRQAEGNPARAALLAGVGDDLRAPLAAIKTATSSLRDPDLTLSGDDETELAATVEESADRLTKLVDDLLDSSRIAAGAINPAPRPIGYGEVVALALTGLGDTRRVAVELDETLPHVLGDPGLLERVVGNVVRGALRRAGGGAVVVRGGAREDGVRLEITEPGPEGDQETDELGLAVARGLTAAMGGTLTADRHPGGGRIVVICLPAALPARADAAG
ncbi:DUF4118 domain-containing protein [Pseudonocardia eucalypti]|uniref:histidine kinase n=1 Tax=Pseudonocardia eucalypti TaxID=648755 RepID=A0ABP9PLE1_9PSEU|nr:two-component system sensor histidine kinase KdpD [Pseudonocardia eucalypti]